MSDFASARDHCGIDGPKPYDFIWFGAMDGPKPYEFIRFGAMDVTKSYEFIGFGAPPGKAPVEPPRVVGPGFRAGGPPRDRRPRQIPTGKWPRALPYPLGGVAPASRGLQAKTSRDASLETKLICF